MSNEDFSSKASDNLVSDHENVAYLAVDIGTTNLKCSLYNQDLLAINSYCLGVTLLYYFFDFAPNLAREKLTNLHSYFKLFS